MDLVVLDQGIDTSTPVGRLFFQIIGAIAEFERHAARGMSLNMPRVRLRNLGDESLCRMR